MSVFPRKYAVIFAPQTSFAGRILFSGVFDIVKRIGFSVVEAFLFGVVR